MAPLSCSTTPRGERERKKETASRDVSRNNGGRFNLRWREIGEALGERCALSHVHAEIAEEGFRRAPGAAALTECRL